MLYGPGSRCDFEDRFLLRSQKVVKATESKTYLPVLDADKPSVVRQAFAVFIFS
jgi:hypothetical protein